MMHIPLKVTFELDTPMVRSAYPIHLDALLAFAQTKASLDRLEDGECSDQLLRSLADNLPLAKTEQGGQWVWQASALIPDSVGQKSIRMWTRKTDVNDYAERVLGDQVIIGARTMNALNAGESYVGKIDTVRGLMKNMFEFYATEEIFTLSAWCIGDPDIVESLLAPESGLITHLGKRGRTGHGRVKTVEITPDEAAKELWKKRVLPWQEKGYEPIQAATRPPYWAAENRQLAYCPVDLA